MMRLDWVGHCMAMICNKPPSPSREFVEACYMAYQECVCFQLNFGPGTQRKHRFCLKFWKHELGVQQQSGLYLLRVDSGPYQTSSLCEMRLLNRRSV